MAAHAEFGAGNADDDLVLHRQHGCGVGLALLRVAVDHLPFFLAGLGVERHQGGIGLMVVDGAVGVSEAAVDGVATHHRNDGRILLGLVLPQDLAVRLEVEGIDDVGERSMNVHDIADHERRAFMAAQHAGRERPRHLQVLDVVPVDLVELRVALVRIVTGLQHPLLGSCGLPQHILIGHRRHRKRDHRQRCTCKCNSVHSATPLGLEHL